MLSTNPLLTGVKGDSPFVSTVATDKLRRRRLEDDRFFLRTAGGMALETWPGDGGCGPESSRLPEEFPCTRGGVIGDTLPVDSTEGIDVIGVMDMALTSGDGILSAGAVRGIWSSPLSPESSDEPSIALGASVG